MAIIQAVDIADSKILQEVGALVRRSFATVAKEFKLTAANCATHPAFQPNDALLQIISKPGAACFGAYQKKDLVGFAALLPDRRGTMELTRLCVDPLHRHHEIGSFLVEYAIAYAQKHGARKVKISIIDGNKQLKAWYRGFGFVGIGQRRVAGLPFVVCDLVKTL